MLGSGGVWVNGCGPAIGGAAQGWSSSGHEHRGGTAGHHRSRRPRGGREPAEVSVLREEGAVERSQPLKIHGAVGLG